MRARWEETIRRFLILANYASLLLLIFIIAIGNRLGWNVYVAAITAVAAAILLFTFYRVHVATGFWRLVHSRGASLDAAAIRLTRAALALAYVWFVVLVGLSVYFRLYVMFGRFSVLDLLALLYLADTLPSALLAWRGERALNLRETLSAWGVRVLVAVVIVAALFTANFMLIRPWQHTWGATAQEARRPMPGDELVLAPDMNATRAVTVHATPAEIWPWILQLGYKRGGFYSYDYLDNDGVPSVRRILPEYQDLAVGDEVPIGEGAFMRVVSLEPQRSLVLQFEGGDWGGNTWVFGLYPGEAGSTRLITRLRVKYTRQFPQIIPWLVLDTGEIVMMRKCLLGIKERAEAGSG